MFCDKTLLQLKKDNKIWMEYFGLPYEKVEMLFQNRLQLMYNKMSIISSRVPHEKRILLEEKQKMRPDLPILPELNFSKKFNLDFTEYLLHLFMWRHQTKVAIIVERSLFESWLSSSSYARIEDRIDIPREVLLDDVELELPISKKLASFIVSSSNDMLFTYYLGKTQEEVCKAFNEAKAFYKQKSTEISLRPSALQIAAWDEADACARSKNSIFRSSRPEDAWRYLFQVSDFSEFVFDLLMCKWHPNKIKQKTQEKLNRWKRNDFFQHNDLSLTPNFG